MIQKEKYIREDGATLYRTYSDTEHLIRHKASGKVFSEAVDIMDGEDYEEMEEYIELDGFNSYEDAVAAQAVTDNITRQINRLHLSNNEALSVMEFYPRWEEKIGRTIEVGYITRYDDRLWKARQTHTALEVYPPSLDTSSLYEVVNEEHSGEADDPIPYTPPMEIFEGKHYIEDGVVYRCTRSSGTALSHNLSALVGLYVEIVN
jgi:hypothetical protein